MRKNTGGNSRVIDYFAGYLKNLGNTVCSNVDVRNGNEIQTFSGGDLNGFRAYRNLFDGKVFILTSHLTFSSAMLFALEFADNNLATIVGEVPGNSPTSFGDISWHEHVTPNSKLKFSTTFKKFYRPDPTKDQDRLTPDIQCPAKEALDKVYKLIET